MIDVKNIGEANRRERAQAEAERGIKSYLIEEIVIKGSGTKQLFLLSAGPNSKPHGFRTIWTPEATGSYNPEPTVNDYVIDEYTQVGVNIFAEAMEDFLKNNESGIEFKYTRRYY